MKKSNTVFIVIIAIIALVALWGIGSRNSLVSMHEEIKLQSANIETELQRRHDLIPNFVATVKGAAGHENDVYTAVADARAKLSGALDVGDLTAMNEANTQLDSAFSRLLMVAEDYPELKANENFTALQDELAGTENRIKIKRENYNEAVASFNKEIKMFPKNIIANMCGFTEAEYLEVPEEVHDVPTVDFNI